MKMILLTSNDILPGSVIRNLDYNKELVYSTITDVFQNCVHTDWFGDLSYRALAHNGYEIWIPLSNKGWEKCYKEE